MGAGTNICRRAGTNICGGWAGTNICGGAGTNICVCVGGGAGTNICVWGAGTNICVWGVGKNICGELVQTFVCGGLVQTFVCGGLVQTFVIGWLVKTYVGGWYKHLWGALTECAKEKIETCGIDYGGNPNILTSIQLCLSIGVHLLYSTTAYNHTRKHSALKGALSVWDTTTPEVAIVT